MGNDTHAVEAEAERLLRALMNVDCDPRGRKWNYQACLEIAPMTLEINRLKKELGAVVLTHSYVDPEIIYGVGDAVGDSYYLSARARESQAKVIVFAGVVFMAETAKILSPGARVIVPDRRSGCSLADSVTGADVRRLKALYPDATVVCYINSTAEVKAESDICVTSGNVYAIVAGLPASRVIFVPDRLMAENLRVELKRRGVSKEVISSDGTCIVHDQFTAEQIAAARLQFPGLKVVA
jgi:quinolinate synthase